MKHFYLLFLAILFSFTSGQVFFGIDPGATALGPNSISARNSFVAALGTGPCTSINTINYDSSPLGSLNLNVGFGTSIAISGNFDSGQSGIRNVPINFQFTGFATSPPNYYQVTPLFSGSPQEVDLTYTFATPQFAFGSYFTGVQPTFGTIFINFHDGTTQTFSIVGASNGGVLFWGFISATPFTSIVIQDFYTGEGDFYGVDDTIIASLNRVTVLGSRFFTIPGLNNQIAGPAPSTCQIGVNRATAAADCLACGGALADLVFNDYFGADLAALTTGFQTCNDATVIYKSFYINSYNANTYTGSIDLTYPAITASDPNALRGVLCQFHP